MRIESQLRIEDALAKLANVIPGHIATVEGRTQLGVPLLMERLLDIETRLHRFRHITQPPYKIGGDDTGKAPVLSQCLPNEPCVLPAVLAIHGVVCGHDRIRTGIDHRFEMRPVHLMECGLINLHVDLETRVFHGIAGKMLDAGHGMPAHAARQRRTQRSQQHRLVGISLLNAAPSGMPRKIDAYATEKVASLLAYLLSDGFADAFLQSLVPCRAACHGHRECGAMPADAPTGTIHEPYARNAEPIHGPHDVWRDIVAMPHNIQASLPVVDVTVQQIQPLVIGELTIELCGEGCAI